MTDFSDLISQAKKMQEKMKETQENLKKIEVEGVSGGNAIKVIMNGEGEMKKIIFNDNILKESKEIVEDLVVAAHNDAKLKLKKKTSEEISKVTGGMPIPPGFKLPFWIKMTESNVKEIEDLIKIISKLPGLGPKSAKRIVLKLINKREELVKPLTNTLAQVYKNVVRCDVCGNLKSLNSNCICSNKKYDQICVVENLADMFAVQSTGIFNGSYHILGGTLPSFEGQKTGNGLLVESLINRIKKNSVKEVILATSASIEGETTAHYISDSLKDSKVKITRLAKGVPVGGSIEHLDDGTLFSAFKNRAPMEKD